MASGGLQELPEPSPKHKLTPNPKPKFILTLYSPRARTSEPFNKKARGHFKGPCNYP